MRYACKTDILIISVCYERDADGDENCSHALLHQFPRRKIFPAQAWEENAEYNAESEDEQGRGRADGLHDAQRREQQRIATTDAAAEIDDLVRAIDRQQRHGVVAEQRQEL